jgi:hypothetical protein
MGLGGKVSGMSQSRNSKGRIILYTESRLIVHRNAGGFRVVLVRGGWRDLILSSIISAVFFCPVVLSIGGSFGLGVLLKKISREH